MKQQIIIRSLAGAFVVLVLGAFCATPVAAAKPRIRSAKAPQAKTVSGVSYSSVRLSRPSHSIIVNILNLNLVNRIEYSLSYSANGIPQGVMGSLVGGGGNQSRDLYFGTCSKGVCTPHYNIQNATLTVTARLKTGSTYIKRYRIKI